MVRLENIKKTFISELGTKKEVFKNLNFHVKEGDFITIIGSNGAGKSTLLNVILGNIISDSGKVFVGNRDVTYMEKHKRNSFISKVYQNPSLGTAPSMTVYENLSMADNKGKKFGLTSGLNKKRRGYYIEALSQLGLGIENQMDTEVGLLSGGQRQCLALIMATLNKPEVLMLDEHTAALDPKTSKIIMNKTREVVEGSKISTLMITHNLQDAIDYGNRMIMLHEGEIIIDVSGKEKLELTVESLLETFHKKEAGFRGEELFSV